MKGVPYSFPKTSNQLFVHRANGGFDPQWAGKLSDTSTVRSTTREPPETASMSRPFPGASKESGGGSEGRGVDWHAISAKRDGG